MKLYHDDVRNLLEEIPCQDYDFIVLDLGIVFEPETDSEKRKEMVQYKVHQFKEYGGIVLCCVNRLDVNQNHTLNTLNESINYARCHF
ncbi:MAG TPA: hypothetical protein VFC74_06500 [Oscillospiraceae bacterium]|nr:hypothetical protein [Oscillospiraceae bacterium]